MNAANKGTGSLEKFWRPGRKEGEVEVRRRQDPSRALGLSSCFDMLSFTPEPQAKLRKVFVRVGQLTLQLTPGSCNIRPFHWGFRGRTRSSLPPPPKPPSLPRPQPTGTEVIVVVNSTRRRRPSFRLSPFPSFPRARSNSSTRLLSGGSSSEGKEDKFYSFRARPRRPRICELRMPPPHRQLLLFANLGTPLQTWGPPFSNVATSHPDS